MSFRMGILTFPTCLAILLVLTSCPAHLSAQQPSFKFFSVEHGLPSNEVYEITEDSLGDLWFATDHGLARYDGQRFQMTSIAKGLGNTTFFGFAKDAHGRTWVRAYDGKLAWTDGDSIRPYKHNNVITEAIGTNGHIRYFGFDPHGDLWFVPAYQCGGFFKIRNSDGTLFYQPITKPRTVAVMRTVDGSCLVTDNLCLQKVALTRQLPLPASQTVFETQIPEGREYELTNQHLSYIRQQGRDYLAFPELLREMGDSIRSHQLTPGRHTLCEIAGRLAVCNSNGVEFPGTNESWFPNTFVNAHFEDARGAHWFATMNGVLQVINLKGHMLEIPGIQPGQQVNRVIYNAGQLYAMGGQGEIVSMTVRNGNPESSSARILAAQEPLRSDFAPDGHGGLFSGYYLEFASDRPGLKGKTESSRITSIHFRHGNWDITMRDGWAILNEKQQIMHNSIPKGEPRFCTAMLIEPEGRIWLGLKNGLNLLEPDGNHQFSERETACSTRVSDLVRHPGGVVIASTRGSGLYFFSPQGGHIKLGTANGLCTNTCGRILLQGQSLWVCSANGLTHVQLSKSGFPISMRCIDTRQGLPAHKINDIAMFDHKLALATDNGLFVIPEASIHTRAQPARAFLTDINGIPPHAFAGIDAHKPSVEFGLKATRLKDNSAPTFRYALRPLDTAWKTTTNSSVRYDDLSPQAYTFEVMASNEDGAFLAAPTRFEFEVPAQLTQTMAFRLLMLGILLACVIGLTYLYGWLKLRGQRMLFAKAEAEMKALRSQMKPHFIFNSLNSLQSTILQGNREEALEHVANMAMLMRRVLENSRHAILPLGEEIDTLKLYLALEQKRRAGAFDYSIDIADQALLGHPFPSLILQPLAENSIWHGFKQIAYRGELKVSIHASNTELTCTLQDNGCGRAHAAAKRSAHSKTSIATENIRERLQILHLTEKFKVTFRIEDLHGPDGRASGTLCIITLPILPQSAWQNGTRIQPTKDHTWIS